MTWAPCPHGVRTRGKKANACQLICIAVSGVREGARLFAECCALEQVGVLTVRPCRLACGATI